MTRSASHVHKRFWQMIRWPIEAIFGFALFYFARLLPARFASAAMGFFLRLLAPLTPWHKRALQNIKHAMPELDQLERDRILRAMWGNFGRVIGEFPHINSIVDKGWVEFVGLEHLRAIDQGGFLIGAHIGNWEFGPFAALSTGKKVAAIYRPLNNPLLSGLLNRRQRTYGGDIYRKGREAALGMMTSLRKGQMMCLLVDQQLREGRSVRFFGHPARTSISHIKVAIKKQAPLLYMRTERLGVCRFRVTISPPIALPATADDAAILAVATAINAEIEGWIRATPEQWFWPHRRWGKKI
ncbi:MAG: lysophospholipid acyltransferase family protein [Candidatus Puniceispirillum sp.]|nr:lysophospholipid acyltransferase family protein [Candidatus Puniceispirillum sp.]